MPLSDAWNGPRPAGDIPVELAPHTNSFQRHVRVLALTQRIELHRALALGDMVVIARHLREGRPQQWFLDGLADLLVQPLNARTRTTAWNQKLIVGKINGLMKKHGTMKLEAAVEDVIQKQGYSRRKVFTAWKRYGHARPTPKRRTQAPKKRG